ncbi:MAG: hypothetical protein ACTS2F_11175 [Thainema sp.]
MASKSSDSKSALSVPQLVSAAIAWAVISLLFFLLFSVSGGDDRPLWYTIATYIFEMVAFAGAAVLCFRNWRSSQIVSGRGVWLAIGLGMASYFLGSLIFGIWEVIWLQDPAVSLADIFYIATYIFLAWGMIQAVLPRRLSLELYQWLIVGVVVVLSVVLAVFLWFGAGDEAAAQLRTPLGVREAVAQTTPEGTGEEAAPAPEIAPAETPDDAVQGTPETEAATEIDSPAPGWVIALDDALSPLEGIVGLLYIIGDVALLGAATTLLLAFWGGRFSQSWRMIAAAAFCLYIADMWFLYAVEQPDYQSGSLPEVFWVFSGVLFAIGAALEYGVSTRSRRGRRRS